MSLHHINAKDVFKEKNEAHYRFHEHIDPDQYPQVHDFYELVLVMSGRLELLVGDASRMLSVGALILIRPGDIHTKKDMGNAKHVNLAFPSEVLEGLFCYLDQEDELKLLKKEKCAPSVQRSPGESMMLQTKMRQLALLPSDYPRRINATLRGLLAECMINWFIPLMRPNEQSGYPKWLRELIGKLDDPANLAQGMDFLIKSSGLTPEHLCRSFQKYLSMTPNTYLRIKRLNYAANLLRHSDHSILDIAYEAGFRSESAFYHNFTEEYGMSPGKYRNISNNGV